MGVRLPGHASPDYNDKSLSDRNFVIWTDKEDRILRDQVRVLGTDKWPMIAAHLVNKTGRQCRRRWQLCLNVPSKKGGWTLEEDRVLFEAHQKHGNRWTEIAKVLPGRTDNAVKNRFTSLIRKHAKESECSQTESSGDVCSDLNKPLHKRRGSDHFSDSNTSILSNGSSKKSRSDGTVQALTPDSVLQQNWRGFMSGAFASPISEDAVSRCAVNNHESALSEELKSAGLFFDGQHDSRACTSVVGESWKDMEWLAMTRADPPARMNYLLNSFNDGASKDPLQDFKENDPRNAFDSNRPLTAVGDLTENKRSFCASPDPCVYQRSSSFLRAWDQLPLVGVQQDPYERTSDGAIFKLKQESVPSYGDAAEAYQGGQQLDETACPTREVMAEDDPASMKSPPHSGPQQRIRTPLSLTPSSRHLMDGMPSPQFSDMERQFLLSALEGCQLSMLDSPLRGQSQADSPCRHHQSLTNKKIRGPLLDALYDTPSRSPLSSYLLHNYQGSSSTSAGGVSQV